VTDIINVCVCPGCARLTTMKQIKGDNYFCRSCKQKFRQFKNGKLIYIPLTVADAIERAKEQLLFDFDNEEVTEVVFEPEFEDD